MKVYNLGTQPLQSQHGQTIAEPTREVADLKNKLEVLERKQVALEAAHREGFRYEDAE